VELLITELIKKEPLLKSRGFFMPCSQGDVPKVMGREVIGGEVMGVEVMRSEGFSSELFRNYNR